MPKKREELAPCGVECKSFNIFRSTAGLEELGQETIDSYTDLARVHWGMDNLDPALFFYFEAKGAGFLPSAGKGGGYCGAIQVSAKGYLQMVLNMAAAAKAVGNRQRLLRLRQAIAPVRRLFL
jgi:hypothetical protein